MQQRSRQLQVELELVALPSTTHGLLRPDSDRPGMMLGQLHVEFDSTATTARQHHSVSQ